MSKKKIAILGGGLGGMTTAYALANSPQAANYDITVYQLGWRLGGKGASGRNQAQQDRIEEHGLHLWFGFYDNAFRVIKDVYAQNNRPLTQPLSTWNEAFKPCDFYVLTEHVNGQYYKWPFPFPRNNEEPGKDDAGNRSLWEYAGLIAKHADKLFEMHRDEMEARNLLDDDDDDEDDGFLDDIGDAFRFLMRRGGFSNLAMDRVLNYAVEFFEKSYDEVDTPAEKAIIWLLERFLRYFGKKIDKLVDDDTTLRRAWILIDLAAAHLLGFLKANVFSQGLEVINEYDYKEWLQRSGASPLAVDSAPVNAVYSAFFSVGQTFEAGMAVNIILHLVLDYKGAFYYRMQAGMGDTIFGPMYEVLKKKGVKFEFFHKVEKLTMSEDQQSIARVDGAVQVTLKGEEYDPLIDVKGLPSWPSNPLYDQLVEGEQLKASGENLEDFWTKWEDVGTFSLEAGKDYDHAVLAIPVQALPYICGDIIAQKKIDGQLAWKEMVNAVGATPTQALQLWFKPDNAGLGWEYWTRSLPFLSTYKNPLDTWADMSDLIIRENWPENHFPNNISYYCNGYIPQETPPPPSDHDYPKREMAKMYERTLGYLKDDLPFIFPNAVDENGEFRWELLVDPQSGEGAERLSSQYLRVNLSPTELYTLSLKNSSKYRLTASGSGFENLSLSGDWIDNQSTDGPMNGGFVEGSVKAGLRAAEAVEKALK